MMQEEDSILIQKVLRGDQQAFSKLVDRHKHTAFGIAYQITASREDAEEIAMDAFVKAYHALGSFKGDSKFSTWFYRIVYNTSISFKRKKRIEFTPLNEHLTENYSEDSFTEGLYSLNPEERLRMVTRIMETLPGEDATLMDLFYRHEMSIEEISQITSLTLSNVKVKLHRIRKRIYAEVNLLAAKSGMPLLISPN